jgi:hypothetical protein
VSEIKINSLFSQDGIQLLESQKPVRGAHTICRSLFINGLSAPPAPHDRIISIVIITISIIIIIIIVVVIIKFIIMIVPKPVRGAAEVALDGTDGRSVLCAGAPAAVDNSDEADQQGRQEAAAAQQLQPLTAKESLVLQRHTCEGALRQHDPQQRVVLHNARRQAAAAGDDKSRCGAERTRHGAVRLRRW